MCAKVNHQPVEKSRVIVAEAHLVTHWALVLHSDPQLVHLKRQAQGISQRIYRFQSINVASCLREIQQNEVHSVLQTQT